MSSTAAAKIGGNDDTYAIHNKMRMSSTAAAAKIGGNDDLLIELLVLLPAKSAVRFKSVCKQWLSLISSEFFTDLHIENHGRRSAETQHSFILADSYGRQLFLCHPTSKKLVRVSLPRPIRHQRWEHKKPVDVRRVKVVKVLQSVNGLLLLSLKFYREERSVLYFREDESESIDYVVFNPATEQYRYIDLDDGYRPIRICLIFDPSKSKYYKLAMSTTAPTRLSVYDSTTHKWSHGTDCPEFWSIPYYRNLGNLCTSSLILDYITGGTSACHNSPEPRELFLIGLKKLKEENKCRFSVGMMVDNRREIRKEATLDFSTIGLLGLIRGESVEDTAFLLHVPGRLLIYRFSDGDQNDLEVLVDYRSDYFYEEDQLQFEYALPFIHTFATV